MPKYDYTTDPPLKRCSKGDQCCHPQGQWLPNTNEFYTKDNHRSDGLNVTCTICRHKQGKETRAKHADKLKQKKANWYKKNPNYNREYRASHGEYFKIYDQEYSRVHAEKKRQKARQWYDDNREYAHAKNKKRYQQNKDAVRIQGIEYRAKNKDRILQQKRRYYNEHKAQAFVHFHRRRARKLSLPDTLTLMEWNLALDYWRNCCAYCGNQQGFLPGMEMSKDHFIPLTSPDCPGTIAANILPACVSCNCSKHNYDAEEWLAKKFNKRYAAQKLSEITAYFEWLINHG